MCALNFRIPIIMCPHGTTITPTLNELVIGQGISFIPIPCWWDGSIEGLLPTLQFHRPDLISHFNNNNFNNNNNNNNNSFIFSSPISLNPPQKYFPDLNIPGVGELMLASFPSHPLFISLYDKWWMGEKYDGIRCCWNPHLNLIYLLFYVSYITYSILFDFNTYTRHGTQIESDFNFNHFPSSSFIDGEIWFGRGEYFLSFMLLKQNVSLNMLRLMAFDIPNTNEDNQPFELRYEKLLTIIDKTNPLLLVVPRLQCDNKKKLNLFARLIIDGKGEGIILRKQNSLYEKGRSTSLIKLKIAQADKEARVIGIDHESIVLELPEGTVFRVPMESVHIALPTVGDVVTVSHDITRRRNNTENDILENPQIVRNRLDLSWQQVVLSYAKDKHYLNESSNVKELSPPKRIIPKTKKTRKHYENYARKNNFNPSNANDWIKHFNSKISSAKGDERQKYHRVKIACLKDLKLLFPEIGISHNRLNNSRQGIADRQKFFEEYASNNSFDPKIPDNWYSHSNQIMNSKGASGVLKYHNYSVSQALYDLFPSVSFDKSKFRTKHGWEDKMNRKRLFEEYAKANSFDPLDLEKWNSHSVNKILTFKRASRVLNYYSYNVDKAVQDLFS